MLYFCRLLCLCALRVCMRERRYILILTTLWVMVFAASAQTHNYHLEAGLQAGCGYYVGDTTPHIFHNVREAYGAHFKKQEQGIDELTTNDKRQNSSVTVTFTSSAMARPITSLAQWWNSAAEVLT